MLLVVIVGGSCLLAVASRCENGRVLVRVVSRCMCECMLQVPGLTVGVLGFQCAGEGPVWPHVDARDPHRGGVGRGGEGSNGGHVCVRWAGSCGVSSSHSLSGCSHLQAFLPPAPAGRSFDASVRLVNSGSECTVQGEQPSCPCIRGKFNIFAVLWLIVGSARLASLVRPMATILSRRI